MKYQIALLLGLATGAAAAIAVLFYNPIAGQTSLSPLMVSDRQQLMLNYSAVSGDSIILTNDGESRAGFLSGIHPLLRYWQTWKRHPAKVLQLWEAPIRQTDVLVTVLRNGRNEPAGIGIKFSSRSESTSVLNGEALIDSAWYIYLPRQGTLLVEQTENHWSFIREVVIPAHWNSGANWRGTWHGTISVGPGALDTARAYGSSGRFAGLESDAIETLTARAYSADVGPVSMEGQLTIEMSSDDDSSRPSGE